jgi:hypothetical protein
MTLIACSWCGKRGDEVRVVAGPDSNICEACVCLACAVLGIRILPEGAEPDAEQPAKPEG